VGPPAEIRDVVAAGVDVVAAGILVQQECPIGRWLAGGRNRQEHAASLRVHFAARHGVSGTSSSAAVSKANSRRTEVSPDLPGDQVL
jgi:hypothetical protein